MSEDNSCPEEDKRKSGSIDIPKDKSHLFDEASKEAELYKWLQSEAAGRDLGEEALVEWHSSYWRSWCRERWIEHLRGEKFWVELDNDDYGLLQEEFHDNLELAEKIIERIKQGGENLDIIQWASDEDYDVETVIEVLKILDINSRRIAMPEKFIDSVELAKRDTKLTKKSSKKRILVVDDDIDTGQLIKELLEKEGLDVMVCCSGEEAIHAFENFRFCGFLIDLMLPGKHGAEIAWFLRRHGVTVPVIAISAILDKWNIDDLYDCGFTGVMAKPFDFEALKIWGRGIVSKKTITLRK